MFRYNTHFYFLHCRHFVSQLSESSDCILWLSKGEMMAVPWAVAIPAVRPQQGDTVWYLHPRSNHPRAWFHAICQRGSPTVPPSSDLSIYISLTVFHPLSLFPFVHRDCWPERRFCFAVHSRPTPSTNQINHERRISTKERCAQELPGSVRSSRTTRFDHELSILRPLSQIESSSWTSSSTSWIPGSSLTTVRACASSESADYPSYSFVFLWSFPPSRPSLPAFTRSSSDNLAVLQVYVALHHHPERLPRLHLRYLHGRDHVVNRVLVQRHLQQLPTRSSEWLCIHPIQDREVALLWVHHLLLPSCMYPRSSQIGPAHDRPPQLAYEARKAKKIIASRDISYAFTNIMANNYYSLSQYISIRIGAYS